MKVKIILSTLFLLSSFSSLSTNADESLRYKGNDVPEYTPEQLKQLVFQSRTADGIEDDYAATQYPVVLVHGMSGFTNVGFNFMSLDYWHQIAPVLKREGADVWLTTVSPFNSTEFRGEQLLQQVKTVLAITNKEKVNLIGHSHGGPTSRYVAGIIRKQIASVTGVASPNKGSPIADDVVNAAPSESVRRFLATSFFNNFSNFITFAQRLDQALLPSNSLASVMSLTTAQSDDFNKRFSRGIPTSECKDGTDGVDGAHEVDEIKFYSFTGNSTATSFLWTDTSDIVLALTGKRIKDVQGANDGLVSVCSSRLGLNVGIHAWNHLDEVNQFAGNYGIWGPRPTNIYAQHLNRLKKAGL